MTKQTFLVSELDKQIHWFEKESTKHKNLHRRLRMLVFVLTGLASVFAGLPVIFPHLQVQFSILILVVTSGLTVLNAVEGLRKANELWIHERTTLYQLHDLRRDLDFQAESATEAVDVEGLYMQLQESLQSSRDRWNRLVGKAAQTSSDTSSRERPSPSNRVNETQPEMRPAGDARSE